MLFHSCLQLQRLIYLLLENLSSLFESLVDTSAIETLSNDNIRVYLNEKVPSLGKLRKLAGMILFIFYFTISSFDHHSFHSILTAFFSH